MSIWKRAATPAELTAIGSKSMPGYLGIIITEVGEDFVRGTMPVNAHTHQPFGLLHGGASVALAETLGSMGSVLCIDSEGLNAAALMVNLHAVNEGQAASATAHAVFINSNLGNGRLDLFQALQAWSAARK